MGKDLIQKASVFLTKAAVVFLLAFMVGCGAQPDSQPDPGLESDFGSIPESIQDPIAKHLNVFQPLSDTNNLCSVPSSSPHVTLPRDYTYHYTLEPLNYQPESGTTAFNGFESTFKFWHWTAVPVGGGAPVRIGAFRAYIALFAPSPFEPNFGFGWFKVMLLNMVGPDGVQHQKLYAAPGQFVAPENGYELSIGDEPIVLDGSTFQPVFPGVKLTQAKKVGGGKSEDLLDFMAVGDPNFRIDSTEHPLKNPNFPFDHGLLEYIDQGTGEVYGLSYYWANSLLATTAKIRYNGVNYIAAGTAWEERQWPGSGNHRWNWSSIQIKGCLKANGQVQLHCPYAGMTLGGFDIVSPTTGNPIIHSLNIVTPPPSCEEDNLLELDDWSYTELGTWVSPRSGTSFGAQLRLQVPSRGIDLMITPTIPDQELYTVAFQYPGTWEGDCRVEGTINGQRVFGDAFWEQFNKPIQ